MPFPHRVPALHVAAAIWLTAAPALVQADMVQVTYSVTAGAFADSNDQPPQPPASDSVSGTYTFTFDAANVVLTEIVPDDVVGLDIVGSDGALHDFDASNSGVRVSLFVFDGYARIVIGGTMSSVLWMVGISNDFRVTFDISLADYSVIDVFERFSYVTVSDPFYVSDDTTVTLVSATVLADSDSDGLFDHADNCVLEPNADQRDTDGDGIGNRCDPDFDQDCSVGFPDLNTMKVHFFQAGDLDTDLDGDHFTDFSDLNILKLYFFGAPGPGLPGTCP